MADGASHQGGIMKLTGKKALITGLELPFFAVDRADSTHRAKAMRVEFVSPYCLLAAILGAV
jgi:hypothetical protein